jgi:RimJ/RimL family protein N-acetyltransferase
MRPADMILTTPRLQIRPWLRADLEAMAAWPPFTDPLDRPWNWPRQLQANGTLDLFFTSQAMDPTRQSWTILIRDGARPAEVAGLLQLKQMQYTERSAVLGISLGAPWVGRGYGQEALGCFLDGYFTRLRFAVMRLEVSIANQRARRLYTRLGFHEISRFWRHAGSAEEYQFLDEPRYADVRPFFRWSNGSVYQQCADMELVRADTLRVASGTRAGGE